jgi:GNAT superfamily N-acetyltransferase
MRPTEPLVLERARTEDAEEIAEVYLAAIADALAFVPRRYSDDEVRRWVRNVMLARGETWVARLGGRIVGFAALAGCMLDQLFLRPGYYRQGIGSLLLDKAKERSPRRLRLYAFGRNLRARAFYEAHGFRIKAIDAAAATQEEPEIAYEWTAPLPAPRLRRVTDRTARAGGLPAREW